MTVLLVMKRPGNIHVMQEALAAAGYPAIGVSDPAQLAAAIADPPTPCIALVDVSGFGSEVWPMCELLRSSSLQFVVLSATAQSRLDGQALSCGAAMVLHKPVAKAALLQLLSSFFGAGGSMR